MAPAGRWIGLALLAAFFFPRPDLRADAADLPPGPIRAVVLERLGYRVGDTPPPAAVWAAAGGGLFRSTSGGEEWTPVRVAADGSPVTTLAILQRQRPTGEKIVAHATPLEYDTTLYAGTAGSGVFRSTDSGESWTPINTGLSSGSVAALLVEASGAIYVATEGGLFLVENGAERGMPVAGSLPKIGSLAADPARGGVLYAGAGKGLYKSADGGRSWAALPIVLGTEFSFAPSSIAIEPGGSSVVFAAGTLSSRGGEAPRDAVFASFDGGAFWSRLDEQLGGPLLFANDGSRLYASSHGGAAETRDRGRSWSRVASDGAALAQVLAVDPDWPGRLYGRAQNGRIARIDARCRADGTTLCLAGGRFRIEIGWDAPAGSSPDFVGALAATSDAGSFWAARPSNVVLTVRVEDRRARNGHFWIHYDTRTTRAFRVTVTDMATGTSTNYVHPEGQRTSFVDHDAF